MTRPNVLIADLDPLSANDLAAIVEEMGCRTFIEDDMKGVIDICEEKDVGVLIIDTSIIAGEGYEVVHILRKFNRDLRIIVTTGTPSEELEKNIRSCGIVFYAPKPVDFYWIKEIIRRSFTRDYLFRSSK
jgi:DNA-binding NtrC family response regulator